LLNTKQTANKPSTFTTVVQGFFVLCVMASNLYYGTFTFRAGRAWPIRLKPY